MKYTFCILVAFVQLVSFSLFAQDNLISIGMGDLASQLHWNSTIQPPSSDIEGSPYLNKEFLIGDVYYSKKYKITEIPLRYNIYNDDMEYEINNSIMAIANPHQIDKVVLGDEVFIYLKNRASEKEEVGGFVKIWNSSSPAIITKMTVKYFEKEPQKAMTDPKPPRFKRMDNSHFLMHNHQDILRIKSVKKLILSLGNHQEKLMKFAKKEKISAKDPEELARLLDYYNGL